MRAVCFVAILVGFLVAFPPFAAVAQTLGGAIENVGATYDPLRILILGACSLAGAWLAGTGLRSLARAATEAARGQDASYVVGFKRLGAGALVFAIPSALGIGLETLWGRADGFAFGRGLVGAPNDCLRPGSGGIACVADNLARNLAPVAVAAAVALSFLYGLWLAAKTLYDWATAQDGGPQRGSVAGRLVLAVLFANVPFLAIATSETLGVGNLLGLSPEAKIVTTSAEFLHAQIGSGVVAEQAATLVRSLFVLLAMFGVVAVLRGLVLIKETADGRGASDRGFGVGVTHVLAGVLMMNMQWTVCTVSMTLVGRNFGICPG